MRTVNLSAKDRSGYDPYAEFFDGELKIQTESTAMALYYGGVENLGLTPTDLQKIYDYFEYMFDTTAPDAGWLYSDYTNGPTLEYKKALHDAWSLIAIDILEQNGITDTANLKAQVRDTLEAAIDSNGYMAGDPDGSEGLRTKFVQSLPFLLKVAQDTSDAGAVAKARLAIDFYMASCIDGSFDVWRTNAAGAKTTLINTHQVMEFTHGLLLFHDYETDATRKTTIKNNLIGILNRYTGSTWTKTNSFGEKYVSDDGSTGVVNSLAQFQIQYILAAAEQRGWIGAGVAAQYLDINARTKMTGTGDPERDNNYFYRHDPDTGAQVSANINSYHPGYQIHAIDAQYKTISGTILDGGSPLAGVAVTADNGGPTEVTDSNGDYTLLVLHDWTGTVTPSLAEYTFSPTSRAYANVVTNDPDEDYAGASGAVDVCGNNILEGAEQCDDGNLADGDCCSSTCTFESAATVCRTSTGTCDVAETCTGSSGVCPVDGFASAATECRATAGDCDVAEACTGGDAACPADGFEPPTTTCRPAVDVCDATELCTGGDPVCPADGVFDGVACADGDLCNGDEMCVVGVCTPGAILDCDDGDACTADSCDAVTGCFNDPIPACGEPLPVSTAWGQLLLALLVSGLGMMSLAWRRETTL
jgi:cysteine-rich repeat protein